MNILAQDPSFAHCACSLFVQEKKKIYIDMHSYNLGETVGFEKVFKASHEIWSQYDSWLNFIGVGKDFDIDVVISEIPPPMGQFSAGLFALDTYLLDRLFYTYDSIKEIYTLPPSFLTSVHGGRYKKSESTSLAKYFISEVFNNEYEIVIQGNTSKNGKKTKGTINNDKAESFIFLLRAMCKFDIDGRRNQILSEVGGLSFESEKLLVSR